MIVSAVDAGSNQVSRSVEVHAPQPTCSRSSRTRVDITNSTAPGTVGENIHAPQRLVAGARFTTKMTMFGVPYRITSTVTAMKPDELIEWRHPVGHHWRWEFAPLTPTVTRVTETFDYRDTGLLKDRLKYYERTGFAKRDAAAIEATLTKLRDRYAC